MRRPGPKAKPAEERFWSGVDRRGDGCWLWQRTLGANGYGTFNFGGRSGRSEGAHRAAWILTNGPIAPGLSVCHRCDVRACCRPDHLFLGSRSENMHDMWKKGRGKKGPDFRPRDKTKKGSRVVSPEIRFWAKVNKNAANGCWLWAGAVDDMGRGAFNGKTRKAHRAAWEFSHGSIPAGLCVCHRCDVPLCCNPAHLFLGTHQENMDDMGRKGRRVSVGRPGWRAEFCVHGHDMKVTPRVAGVCVACAQARHRARYVPRSLPHKKRPGGKRREFCLRGHLLADTAIVIGRGERVCRLCAQIRKEKWKARRSSPSLSDPRGT